MPTPKPSSDAVPQAVPIAISQVAVTKPADEVDGGKVTPPDELAKETIAAEEHSAPPIGDEETEPHDTNEMGHVTPRAGEATLHGTGESQDGEVENKEEELFPDETPIKTEEHPVDIEDKEEAPGGEVSDRGGLD